MPNTASVLVSSAARIGDKGNALAVAKSIISERLTAASEAVGAARSSTARLVAEASTRRNLDIIHENSRSRTEAIFLTAVVLANLEADPPGAIFIRSAVDSERYVAGASEYYRRGAVSPENAPSEHDAIREILRALALPEGISGCAKSALHELAVQGMALGSKLHVMLHPEISLARTRIPADALFWVPNNDRLRILMDCERFTLGSSSTLTDAAIEKQLLAKGYATVRYSSEQVLVDPIAIAHDVFWHVVLHV